MSDEAIHKLTMPKWGMSMQEGKIAAWLVAEGDEVGPGSEVVEVETDKIVSGVEPSESGVLRRQVAKEGDVIPVSGLIGIIADDAVADAEIDAFVEDFQANFTPEVSSGESGGPSPTSVDVNGKSIRYLVRGEGGEPAILIHGFGGDLNNWLFNHSDLAENRAIYALDLPGHGGSSKEIGDGGLSELADLIVAFMDSVGLDKSHLVGHSLGGAIALELALRNPARTLSLTLLASAGLGEEIDGQYVEGFIASERRRDLKPHLQKLFADPSLVNRRLIDDVLKFKRIDGVSPALRKLADQFCSGGKQSVVHRDRLAEISVPVQVIWGAKDQILPVSHAEGLPDRIAVRVFPDAGHMAQMEAASEVNQTIDAFWAN
jgi:pyruvate dehydrogenase E2 component (dihydrolipoamide acetyltransferase)